MENKIIVEGDINDRSFGITQETFEILLKTEEPADAIALYNFYCYTSKFQKTNQIWCTTGFAARGLKWGEDKVRRAKKMLVNIGIVEDLQGRNEAGAIEKHYIKVKYILGNSSSTLVKSQSVETASPGKTEDKCLTTNTSKCLTTETKTSAEAEKQSFEEYMTDQGCYLEEVSHNDETKDCWFREGRMLSAGAVTALRRSYSKLHPSPILPVPKIPTIFNIFNLFRNNPASETWKAVPIQRQSASALLERFSMEEIEAKIAEAKRITDYPLQITSPYDLLQKWSKIEEGTKRTKKTDEPVSNASAASMMDL